MTGGGRWSRSPRGGDEPKPLGEMLGQVAGRLGMAAPDLVGAVFARWETLVGPSVAAHARPVRIDGESLVVEVDHPAWATQLRLLAGEVLARVAEHCPGDDTPTRLEVRVRR